MGRNQTEPSIRTNTNKSNNQTTEAVHRIPQAINTGTINTNYKTKQRNVDGQNNTESKRYL